MLLTLVYVSPQMKETIMNQEKLAKLQAQVRIGGKVTAKITLKCYVKCPKYIYSAATFVLFVVLGQNILV